MSPQPVQYYKNNRESIIGKHLQSRYRKQVIGYFERIIKERENLLLQLQF